MVSTRSTPSKRTAAASPSPSPAERTTNSLSEAAKAAMPRTIPTSPADLPSLPTLDDAPTTQVAKSHLVLVVLVSGCVVAGWLLGFDLLQVSGHNSWLELAALLAAFAAFMVAMMHWMGAASLDFWAMLHGYWWLSVPVVMAGMLAITVMEERATGLHEAD